MDKIEERINILLNKPVLLEKDNQAIMIIVFGYIKSVEHSTLETLARNSRNSYTIKILNVNETLENNRPIIHILPIDNFDEFENHVKTVEITQEFGAILDQIIKSLSNEISDLQEEMDTVHQVIGSINFLHNKISKEAGTNMLLKGIKNPVAYLNVQHLKENGLDEELSSEVLELAGKEIAKFVLEKLEEPQESLTKNKKKLKAELEYKIIEVMPNSVVSKQLEVNIDGVLNEIKEIKKRMDNGEDEQEIFTGE